METPNRPMSMFGASTGPEPRPKRIKIDIACTTCRTRKVKCDGIRPACGNCSRKLELRGTCTYTPSSGNSSTSGTSGPLGHFGLSSSNHRNSVRDHESPKTTTPDQGTAVINAPREHQRSWLSERSVSREPTNVDPALDSAPPDTAEDGHPSEDGASTRSRGPRSAISPSVINSMTAVVDEGTSTREYFGSSSAGSFTAQIKKAIDARLGKSPLSTTPVVDAAVRVAPQHASAVSAVSFDVNRVLPTRRQADHLMSLYWKYVDPLYPFLDRATWGQQYSGIFNGDVMDIDERTFIATMNIIFALATQLQEALTPEQREQASNVFFVRAKELLPLNTWDPGSVELVQYLLLASQYLQSTDHPHETWMVVGSAIRIAQGLGLHLNDTFVEQSRLPEDLLRRIWYGCVLMDRMVAVTHGRPPMMSSQLATSLPLPQHLPQHETTSPASDPGGTAHSTFFIKSVQLYEIIQHLYYGPGERSKGNRSPEGGVLSENFEDLGMVIQLDRDLVKWERSLPEWLKCTTHQTRDEVTHRQAVVLHIRLLHARILLLRPILARFCLGPCEPPNLSDNVESRVVHQCALLCLSTAQELIAALLRYQAIDGTVGLLPAWWYRVYYVYTAATVLIAAKLRPDVFPKVDLHRAWSQALSVLRAHEGFGQSVRKCVTALHFLSSKIVHDGNAEAAAGPNSTMDVEESQLPPIEGFPFPVLDLDQQQLDEVQFDPTNLAWLNDMHAAWDLINQG